MVDLLTAQLRPRIDTAREANEAPVIAGIDWNSASKQVHRRCRSNIVLFVVILTAAISALALDLPGGADSVRTSHPSPTTVRTAHVIDPKRANHGVTGAATAAPPTPSPTTPTATASVVAPTAPVPPPTVAPVAALTPQPTGPSVETLVAEVEATGVDPGPNWSWSMGDTATQCGAIPGNNVGTGCTFGAAGFAKTVFAGSPSLALVAHELANAETENDAVPNLINQVATAEAGTSWSTIDAVASCLVEHFMGFQDVAAGTWQCSTPLATLVAENIHNAGFTTTDVLPS